MDAFDLLGPLPTGTTVLEASAGTGKTYTVAGLVTRYVAEGRAVLDEMLVITFGRLASQELRERVRDQLVEASRALADPATADTDLLRHLVDADATELALRRRRVQDALAGFDGATIATTHQFCQLVLRSLGVAGDTDAHATLVEDLGDLVQEVVDDLYLQRFASSTDPAPITRDVALRLARHAIDDPQAVLAPTDAVPGTLQHTKVWFAEAVREEVERRKQRLGILSYDDLLSRLADALDAPGSPAAERMRERWSIVLVDEFQDTDPVQWQVLERAFQQHRSATLVLIGDPKQAIYAFRGGDVASYLAAAATAGTRLTLDVNHRSDGPLVEALQSLTRGAALGDERITVHPIRAAHAEPRIAGTPVSAPVRLRVVPHDDEPTIPVGRLREAIAEDLADDVATLLTSGATHRDRAVEAGDVAILLYSLKQAHLFADALTRRNIPSVVASTGSVLTTPAGAHWLTLLEALERQQSGRVRSVALTPFVGETPVSLDAGGDDLTDAIAEKVRGWLDLFRTRGVAAVHEAAVADGLVARVLRRPEGERLLTDLDHVAEVLHDVTQRQRLGLPALLEWLRAERRATIGTERPRRLDTDAAAVQIITIHRSKGLQYPFVYLPLAFNRWVADEPDAYLFHQAGERMLHVGGSPVDPAVSRQARAEDAAEELRLTYVALTRAQSQVVAWWGPSRDAVHGGISRLLFGREPGEAQVPERLRRIPSADDVTTALARWEREGALHVEQAGGQQASLPPAHAPEETLAVRPFQRLLDTAWRRTSYSGLIRVDEPAHVTEPEDPGTVDEPAPDEDDGVPTSAPAPAEALVSPMDALPGGAGFGSLVHGVLEIADAQAPDLRAELLRALDDQLRWWPVDTPPEELADALLPMMHTPLGPLGDQLTLAQVPMRDRLCELDFEIPLVGGDATRTPTTARLGQIAGLLRRHLPDDDLLRPYADQVEAGPLGEQLLRGYLSGSIDVVLRTPGGRFVVVDYKTNRLGTPGEPLTALDYTQPLMAASMLHSHYPLQALLYSAVLHRYLRWRVPDYDPERHLGGVLYLYVRGMCGPETPVVDGVPCGVMTWQPPAELVVALSDLLAGGAP